MPVFTVVSKLYRSITRGRRALRGCFGTRWELIGVELDGFKGYGVETIAVDLGRFEGELWLLYSNWEFEDANSEFRDTLSGCVSSSGLQMPFAGSKLRLAAHSA